MKKTVVLVTAIIVCFIITSFINKQPLAVRSPQKNSIKNIDCVVPFSSVVAARFIAPPSSPAAVMIRKSIYSYSAADITSLKNGITAMKALPLTNPTSWQYQAAIHGTTLSNNLPSWNSCQHGTQFFFSWHRMYLYFFERILRAKSGNPNLTLPYWDYQANPALPSAYRSNVAGNSLYDGSRSASINSGGSLPAGIMTSFTNAMTNISFFDFQSDIEGPHGSVHVSIGGNMGSVQTAGLDPCFWLHHTNIDRLWEAWLKKCGSRSNPTEVESWMNQTYTFYDENGAAVNMTGSQVVNTAASLNYRYDFPLTLPCNLKYKWWIWKWKWWELLRFTDPVIIDKPQIRTSFKEAKQENLRRFLAETKTTKFNFSLTNISDKLIAVLEDVKIEKQPEGVVEVYLNLKAGEAPNAKSKSFAGVLDLFTATAAHKGHADGMGNNIRINLTTAARNLGLKPADLVNAELTFVVRGNTLKQREIRTTANIRAGALVLGIEKAAAEQ